MSLALVHSRARAGVDAPLVRWKCISLAAYLSLRLWAWPKPACANRANVCGPPALCTLRLSTAAHHVEPRASSMSHLGVVGLRARLHLKWVTASGSPLRA